MMAWATPPFRKHAISFATAQRASNGFVHHAGQPIVGFAVKAAATIFLLRRGARLCKKAWVNAVTGDDPSGLELAMLGQ